MSIGWLIFIAVVLIIIVLFQVTRTLDLVSQLRGNDDEREEHNSKVNGIALFIFMVLGVYAYFWCFGHFKNSNLPPASEHGYLIEDMILWTLIVCSIVFIICNILLFTFSLIYRYKKGRETVHFAHSNKLEFIWTIIPTIVLTGLVIFGLQAWTKIMSMPDEDTFTVEVTGQQFFWTTRYPGADGKLGARDYNLICPDNPLGIITKEFVEHRINLLQGNAKLDVKGEIKVLEERKEILPGLIDSIQQLIEMRQNRYRSEDLKDELDELEDELDDIDSHIITRVKNLDRINTIYTPEYFVSHQDEITWGYDDFMPSEMHVPVNEEVLLKIQALDVLHNFYIVHMKVKMDAVPGMPTFFKFTPITTTAEMREVYSKNPLWQQPKEGDETKTPKWKNFQYEIACAELCGTGHSAMKYILVVDTEAEYEEWVTTQKPAWNNVVGNLKIEGLSELAPKLKSVEPVATDSINLVTDTSTIASKGN
ncbi:MAG: cytochrome c oxidase subunit II [Fimbriimonadaceae bacterium]|nr:cytochrome c oxidase subunit II [Chitinophagales bacterium]